MQNKNSIPTEKFDMLNEDQKFVNQILEKYGKEITWLAGLLNMDYETVRYQLRDSKNYRQDFHKRVIEILKREGIVTSNSECTEKVKDELIDFSAILTGSVNVISKSIIDRLPAGLDLQEKKEIKSIIRNQMNRVTDQFNDLLITIDLK